MSAFQLRLTGPLDPAPAAPAAASDLSAGLRWIDCATASRRSGLSEGQIRRLCGESWQARGVARLEKRDADRVAQWYIHESAEARVAPVQSLETIDAAPDVQSLSERQRRTMLEREAVLQECQTHLAAAAVLGISRDAAMKSFAARRGGTPSPRTLYSWIAACRSRGRSGLIDGRANSPPADDEPGQEFRALLREIYLATRRNGLGKTRVYEIACYEADRRGLAVPAARTARRWLAEIPQADTEHAKGAGKFKAFTDNIDPYIERDYSSIASNAWWCSDDHHFDVIVNVGVDKEGKPKHARPWLHAWQDVRSRKIVGWAITVEDPNANLYLDTVCDAMDHFGVPGVAYVDNGKAFDSRKLQGRSKKERRDKVVPSEEEIKRIGGAFALLEVKTVFAWKFHGQSKPVERAFGTLCGRFAKLWDTYCGSSPDRKPEGLAERVQAGLAPTLDEFINAFGEWLENDYHARAHTGDSMDGQTPDQVYAQCLVSKRVLPREQLEFACRPRYCGKNNEGVVIRQNGVTYSGLMFGRNDPTLTRMVGTKVILIIPRKLDHVILTDMAGRRICDAAINEKSPWTADLDDAALRSAIAEKKRVRKAAVAYHEARPRLALDIPDLALRAAAEKAKQTRAAQGADGNPPPSLQPVRTAVDGESNDARTTLPMRLAVGSIEPANTAPAAGGQFNYQAKEFSDE